MTKNYIQRIQEQGNQIEAILKTGLSKTLIAETIGVNRSTIHRELQRNIAKRGKGAKIYCAKNAQ